MNYSYDSFSTPFGEFSAAVDDRGAVVATAFGDRAALQQRLGAGELTRAPERLAAVRREILDYLAGRREMFTIAVAPRGTPFQQEVWTALRRIPRGSTRSYGELATKLGHPGAARAVGRANATNPVCLLIPCHRVIGSNGSLTGFAFGEETKARLLKLEGATVSTRFGSKAPAF